MMEECKEAAVAAGLGFVVWDFSSHSVGGLLVARASERAVFFSAYALVGCEERLTLVKTLGRDNGATRDGLRGPTPVC